MPAIIGPVQIVNIGGGTIQFGDCLYIAPKSNSKTNAGQGAFNTGGIVISNNGLNSSNVLDCNLIDQPNVGNA